MESYIEYTMDSKVPMEPGLHGYKLALKHNVNVDDGRRYLLVPFSMRMVPLIAWGCRNGYHVISEDFGETDEFNPHLQRDWDLPNNVSIGRFSWLKARGEDMGRSVRTYKADESVLGWSGSDAVRPGHNAPLRSAEWTSFARARKVVANYVIDHFDERREEVELQPDIFIYEHPDGEYSVLSVRRDELSMKAPGPEMVNLEATTDSAVDIFVRMQAGATGFRLKDSDSDTWEDLRSAQVRIAVATARRQYKKAALIAANFFDVPAGGLNKYLPDTWTG